MAVIIQEVSMKNEYIMFYYKTTADAKMSEEKTTIATNVYRI